jgi:phosphatidylglycerol:prolipoprotein diacylglycerol transferase
MNHHLPIGGAYSWLLLLGIAVTAWMWSRLIRREDRLWAVYAVALVFAFVGAKMGYLLGEGWKDWGQPQMWHRWLIGKSIMGALLGGYVGVELAKYWSGYRGITGDWFAGIVPAGIILGRLGCAIQGCCLGSPIEASWFAMVDAQGIARWPAVAMEIGFNIVIATVFLVWRRQRFLPGQHYHVYLMAYGLFRFLHEFARATPRFESGFSGYQVLALAMVAFGAAAFWRRAQSRAPANQLGVVQ